MPQLSTDQLLDEQRRIHERIATQFGLEEREIQLLGHHTLCLLSVLKECLAQHGSLLALDGTITDKSQINQRWIDLRAQALTVMFYESMLLKEVDHASD